MFIIVSDDMVIEYVGELVRPSVADARERASYDSLVGAGTYIFRLNMKECVDATRSGNLAHLLNHSCDPNCYSRTVSGEAGHKILLRAWYMSAILLGKSTNAHASLAAS